MTNDEELRENERLRVTGRSALRREAVRATGEMAGPRCFGDRRDVERTAEKQRPDGRTRGSPRAVTVASATVSDPWRCCASCAADSECSGIWNELRKHAPACSMLRSSSVCRRSRSDGVSRIRRKCHVCRPRREHPHRSA